MDIFYIDKCPYEIKEETFRYGTPVYTDPFRALQKPHLKFLRITGETMQFHEAEFLKR